MLIENVSDTAFMVAQYRAMESARPDALFQDPFAARLAGEKGRLAARTLLTRWATSWAVAIRTVIIDDFIRDAIANGTRIILNLGAGLDARPYRMDLPPDLIWIEADYADVLAYKQEVLAGETPRCQLEQIAVDLSDARARREFLSAVQARGARTLVLTEGVIIYLPESDVADLADDLRAMTNVNGWIVDYFARDLERYRRRSGVAHQMKNAPFKFRPADWFGFFAAHGWKPREVKYSAQVSRQLHRRPDMPKRMRLVMTLARLFSTPARRRRLSQLHGYVLLEPIPKGQLQ